MSDTKKYYDALKNEEYTALRDSEVQASIAKENALKYMQNSMNAQGYGNQGVSESANAGVFSQYSNALSNAQKTYRENINQINENERQALKSEADAEFQTLTSLMNNATNQTQLNDIIGRYGITINEDGTFNYSDDLFSDNDKRQFEIVYSLMNNQLEANNYAGREANLTGDLVVYDANGNYARDGINAEQNFSGEISTLRNNVLSGSIPDGSYIHLQTMHGGNVYLIYRNGQFYYTTPEDYNNYSGNNAYYINGYNNMQNIKK